MDQTALFQLVPVGKENAVSARMIERKKVHIVPTDKVFYFRKPDR